MFTKGKNGIIKDVRERVILKKIFTIILLVTSTICCLFLIFLNVCFEKVLVNGESMYPTLKDQEIGLYLKKQFIVGGIKRNDIVIFDHENNNNEDKLFIKRVIGLPNEKIEIREDGSIYIDEEKIMQKYLDLEQNKNTYQIINSERMEMTLKEDEYFVLGDNRGNSYDSRFFGPIKKDEIIGKLSLIYGHQEENHNSGKITEHFFPIKLF